jgi:two-component system cell cycle sensor histidine kinase/response regulator CckA
MRRPRVVLIVALGLFVAHVAVAAASTRLGPLPLSSHLLQLAFGLLAAVSALSAAYRSKGMAQDFWWFAAAGFFLWCIGQALDTFFGIVLAIPFEHRWAIDVFYYAWPAALLICLALTPGTKKKGWLWERVLDFMQAGILLVLLYAYFADLPMHARGLGVWKLSFATDGLMAMAFFARSAVSRGDPARPLFRGMGYFRLAAFATDLYFVLGWPEITSSNWFDLIWTGQWLIPIAMSAMWLSRTVESEQEETLPDAQPLPSTYFLSLTFPILVVLLAGVVAKGQSALATIAIGLSLSVAYGRLILSRRQEQASLLDRNQAVQALAENEQRFRTLFEGSPIGIVIVDVHGREVFSNPAYRVLLGIGAQEELSVENLMLLSNPETRAADRAVFFELASGEKSQARYEKQYFHRDGKIVWVDLSLFLQRDFTNQPKFVICMAVNITERKQLELQLRQAQRMETIGRLAGGVAHDFNNLLTVIKGYCALVLDSHAGDPILHTRMERIDRAAGKASSLTHQLLAFSRQQVLQPRALNLNSLVTDTAKMLERLIGENIAMTISTAPDLGTVLADPGQMEQVILNLAVNARDAMPNGGDLTLQTANVELDENFARSHPGAQPGRFVMLSVSDTGIGMNEETVAHVFEPFFTTKELGKGTGLGLSMVYGIVRQSKGHIWVDSEVGRGTTFSTYLPRTDVTVDEANGEALVTRRAAGNESILVVEDDPQVRELAREVLAEHGYRVAVAASPQEALAFSEQSTGFFHLLLTDVVMPAMSGKALAGRLREKHKGLRVVFMSGYIDPQLMQGLELDHHNAFLQKPFTPHSLNALVRETIDHAAA